ncbi:MAG: hypothetical protein HFI84_04495 [Eubacterium sp.]|nr:hypothetical protein [Eubacterium sp.]
MKGNVVAMPKYLKRKCPFCFGELGRIEGMRRRIRKVCRCKNCGQVIDEKGMFW